MQRIRLFCLLIGLISVNCVTWKEYAEEWNFSTTEPFKPLKFMIDFIDKDNSIRARNNAFYKMSEAQLKSREETLGIGRYTPGFLLEEDLPIKKVSFGHLNNNNLFRNIWRVLHKQEPLLHLHLIC